MKCKKNTTCFNVDSDILKLLVRETVREEIERQRRENLADLLDKKLQKTMTTAIIEAIAHKEAENEKKSNGLTTVISVTVALWYTGLFAIIGAFALMLMHYYPSFQQNLTQNNMDELKKALFSFLMFFIIVMLIALAATMLMSAIKMFKEKDRDFLMSSMANVVGMTALIIAFIALFVGGK